MLGRGGMYTGVTCPFITKSCFRGITSKVLKLVTSNFIHRYVILWRSAVYKNHNSIPAIFGVISLCLFFNSDFSPGHNFQSTEASNFKLNMQIDHIKEQHSVQEP